MFYEIKFKMLRKPDVTDVRPSAANAQKMSRGQKARLYPQLVLLSFICEKDNFSCHSASFP